ncbi:NADAR family protein [Ferruginibacter sp.]
METKATRIYSLSESIVFRKTKEDFGGLSNMAAGYSIKINDIIVPSAEHMYQACRFPDYPQIQWDIINEKSPMSAKWISRANTNLTRPDWNDVRFKMMQWVIEVKLSQNWEKFSQLLIATGNKPIVEASPKDKVWGAVKKDDNTYVGINALGRILMLIRKEFIHNSKPQKCVETLNIDNFKFLGNTIEKVCKDEYSEHECYSSNEADLFYAG